MVDLVFSVQQGMLDLRPKAINRDQLVVVVVQQDARD